MDSISAKDVYRRLSRDNPWWNSPTVQVPEARLPRRQYFPAFRRLALDQSVKRATVLLGPRRVGKTVMIKQLVAGAIEDGFHSSNIMYASVDAPIYSGMALEKFIEYFIRKNDDSSSKLVVFDEIQYLRNWEVHLKDLVDNYQNIKFVVSGSAAAALRLKSKESGAGRFSEFMLPPLTFHEFLLFSGEHNDLVDDTPEIRTSGESKNVFFNSINITKTNEAFVNYLNYGGYPEAVFNETIRNNPDQFIKNDIIDKVLLKDLPSLYGIHDINELNRLFSVLAYNAGNEVNLEAISKSSGLTKPTIKRYIEYLISAFLIIKIGTVDEHCRKLERERNFKIYLNNPSMRAALFAPVSAQDTSQIGHLAECAVFSQWQHSTGIAEMRYARWRGTNEVDLVFLDRSRQRPAWIGEIKWSNRVEKQLYAETKSLRSLASHYSNLKNAVFTTRSWKNENTFDNLVVLFIPTAMYCYTVGRNITSHNHLNMSRNELLAPLQYLNEDFIESSDDRDELDSEANQQDSG